MFEVIYTDEFEEWFWSLSEGEREALAQSVGLLERVGTNLSFPHSSSLRGTRYPLRELRVSKSVIRVAYAFDPRRDAVLLVGGSKSGGDKRFYQQLVSRAEAVWEQYLKEQGL